MRYAYVAFDRAGRRVGGALDAADAAAATQALRAQGLFGAQVTVAAEGGAPAALRNKGAGAKVGAGRRLRDLAAFSRQVHVLVATGTPLVQALAAVERQVRDARFREVVAAVRARVEAGVPLAVAMEERPDRFDPVCRSLVAAGESSGALPAMLERLAALARRQLQVRTAVVGALVYPALLSAIGVAVTALMLLFVLPRFAGLFESLDTPLPPTTRALLAASAFLTEWWWAALLALAGGGTGLKLWLSSPAGRTALDSAALAAPKVGLLVRSLMSARVARLLGTLLESRVPLLEALALVRQGSPNARYAALIAEAEHAVSTGQSVSSVLGASDLITPAVQEVLRNGEQSGQVGRPLLGLADFLDEENEVIVKSMLGLLEPVILIALGAVVGLMALSMFLPLFDLVATAGGGAGAGGGGGL